MTPAVIVNVFSIQHDEHEGTEEYDHSVEKRSHAMDVSEGGIVLLDLFHEPFIAVLRKEHEERFQVYNQGNDLFHSIVPLQVDLLAAAKILRKTMTEVKAH